MGFKIVGDEMMKAKKMKIDVDELDDISLFWLVIYAFEH
jgi:hypothetical protein